MKLLMLICAVLLATAPAFAQTSLEVPTKTPLQVPRIADGPPNPEPSPIPRATPRNHHPAEHQSLHAEFYSTWMRPDMPNVSCCNMVDCEPVKQVRKVGERWEAQRESDDAWVIIPPQVIEQQRDSPDGRSHVCSRGVTVFCFVHGSGT